MSFRIVLAIGLLCFAPLVAVAGPPITAALYLPDGSQLLLGSQSGIEARSWPDLKQTSVVESDFAHVHDLAISPDGKKLLVAGGSPGEHGFVDVLSWPAVGRLLRIRVADDLVYRVAWSPDGEEFATAEADGICSVFATKSGERRHRYEGHSRAVLAISYLPDAKSIVSAGVDQTLQLWDSQTGKQLRSLDNHLAAINDLAVRPNANRDATPIVATVSDDRTVRLWQPTIGRLMRFAKLASPVRAMAWSNDGRRLVVACNDGTVNSIDPETLAITPLKSEFAGRLHTLIALPHHQWLIGGENGLIEVVK